MSNYSNTYGGAAKDTANAVILGADHDTQYDNIATMSATKADKIGSATDGNIFTMDANGNLQDSGVAIGAITSAELALLAGLTSTTAELNILDGVTATATELNFVSGVTSSIQTQLDGLNAPALDTPIVTTSGTAHTFSSIPSWVTEIVISYADVGTSTAESLNFYLGDSGGIETTGYSGAVAKDDGVVDSGSLSGIQFGNTTLANNYTGRCVITLLDSSTNTWAYSGQSFADNVGDNLLYYTGRKSLTAVLTQVQLTTAGGTGTFDSGKVNIRYS